MGSHFDALLRSGVTEQYDPACRGTEGAFAAVVNPLHVVLKPNGSIWPITHPSRSGVKDCMVKLPCPRPDLATLLQHLPQGGFLGKRDLANGFHHVKLAPDARRFMAFRHPTTDALQRWVDLPFGASQSPAIFVELTTAAAGNFQRECDRRGLKAQIVIYVDFAGERGSGVPLFVREVRGARHVAWERAGFTSKLPLLIKELQRAVPGLSVDLTALSAHSLRRGGATAAANGAGPVPLQSLRTPHGSTLYSAVHRARQAHRTGGQRMDSPFLVTK